MNKSTATAISPTREEDFPEWYQQVVKAAQLAESSPVRGSMVINPWGYSIWENIQTIVDKMLKDTGHQNAYFPLFIPKSFLEKEAQHVEGFAKECAVVTHTRLELNDKGQLVPASPLDEPLIVRPTSETIIGEMFSKWIQSHRDLPLLINQWCNVVRWEMRTRLFLRTTEFLWQEGHTAHATQDEAIQETLQMLDIYNTFCQNFLAIPIIKGKKTDSERFPGAVTTYCIETMMQDGKALQAGTSHFLGQNFAKASNIKFVDKSGKESFVWTTSWAVTTRLIGALIMTHSDDNGLVLPPRIAPSHIAIIPVIPNDSLKGQVLDHCKKLKSQIESLQFHNHPIKVILDSKDSTSGEKNWHWIKKGIPLRLEVGPRDIQENKACLYRRDSLNPKEKSFLSTQDLLSSLPSILQSIQDNLFQRALNYRSQKSTTINSKEDFYNFFTPQNPDKPEIHGGFAYTHWNESPEIEEMLKKDLKVTIRCIPLDAPDEPGICPFSGQPSPRRVIFAKSY